MAKDKSHSILILYHFYKPDDVISAIHFADLAEGLAKRNWNVSVFTSNRLCRKPDETITIRQETINKVKVIRHSRPGLDQSKNISRLINSVYISTKWLISIIFSKNYDIILLGTDPQMGYFIVPFIKLFKPKTKIAMWAFDLYPEIIEQMGMAKWAKVLIKSLLTPWTRLCFRYIDMVADLGECMKKRLLRYKSKASRPTLVPWAISEPGTMMEPDQEIRKKLFGDAKIGILYSGTIGHAHQFEEFIALARELRAREASVSFCFAGRGNGYQQLQDMILDSDTNISFAGFADEKELALRLTAADIHLISLKEGWEGLVVPSKFFGSLAAGRPLIYAGTPKSAIRKWIAEFNIGYYLDSSNIKAIADNICVLEDKSDRLKEIQTRTFNTWQANFAREKVIDSFDNELSKILER